MDNAFQLLREKHSALKTVDEEFFTSGDKPHVYPVIYEKVLMKI